MQIDKFNESYADMIVESNTQDKILFSTDYSYDQARAHLQEEFLIENPTEEELELEIKNHLKVEYAVLETKLEKLNSVIKNPIVAFDAYGHWHKPTHEIHKIGEATDILKFLNQACFYAWELYIYENDLYASCTTYSKIGNLRDDPLTTEAYLFRQIADDVESAKLVQAPNTKYSREGYDDVIEKHTMSIAEYF